MDRNTLVDRAETRFRDTGNAIVTAVEWGDYVNDSYFDVVTASPFWPFLESRTKTVTVTAADTDGSAALPTDVFAVTAVYNATDDSALQPLDGRADYRHWFPDPENNRGTPEFYRLRNNRIEVFPFPAVDTTLHVDHPAPPLALGAADEPAFPESYHRMLVSGALAYAYEDDGNPEQAQLHRSTFDRLLVNMMNDLLGTRTETYPQIIDSF